VYRSDFGLDPLSYWRENDAPDRQGISEIRHVTAYLALWDELRRRHPHLQIDSCSGGGHRNDLETLRRSVPLLRSDYILDPVGNQCHTYGLSMWLPYHGTGFIDFNPYLLHSMMGPGFTLSCDARRKDLDWDGLRDLVAQWRAVVPNFFGDFYPLLPYSLSNHTWMAWQFDRPEAGEGIVQVFRREQSSFRSADLRLRGLDPQADYTVTDLTSRKSDRVTGSKLLENGLTIEITDRPGSVLLQYKRL
jgi:alpha-galactosidase